MPPRAVLRAGPDGPWQLFDEPVETREVRRLDEVQATLREVGERVEREGSWAVIVLAYEAAPAFDEALTAHAPSDDPHDPPLLWIAWFPPPRTRDKLPEEIAALPLVDDLTASVTREEFLDAFERIQNHIAAGDTYQVNYSFRLRASFAPSDSDATPWSLFRRLVRAQQAPYAAYVDLGDSVVVSASPELFFEQRGDSVTSRPMKGTAPRGRTWAEDEEQARNLAASPKERAENLMVVDMIRNDLGRIARPGTVRVPELFTVERYPTVLQMTSTVTAETDRSPVDVLAALFPCASITGAPKISTSRILAELEPDRRGVYTGSVGVLAPGRRARWNVAIRTATVNRRSGRLEYGVGGGIVADSDGGREYEECRLKARVLLRDRPAFELLETLLWDGDYWLLPEHLERLETSARYFGFPWLPGTVRDRLDEAARPLPDAPHKVRLTLSARAHVHVTAEALPRGPAKRPDDAPPEPLELEVAGEPVSSDDVFLFHKTTFRRVYDEARTRHPAADEVLLINERGELTEGTRFNLVLDLDGILVTPPVSSGLLAGTFRSRLLRNGTMQERIVRPDDLERADGVWLVNGVRGFRRAVLRDG